MRSLRIVRKWRGNDRQPLADSSTRIPNASVSHMPTAHLLIVFTVAGATTTAETPAARTFRPETRAVSCREPGSWCQRTKRLPARPLSLAVSRTRSRGRRVVPFWRVDAAPRPSPRSPPIERGSSWSTMASNDGYSVTRRTRVGTRWSPDTNAARPIRRVWLLVKPPAPPRPPRGRPPRPRSPGA